ncbi:hypothetical protein EMCRGX_G009774 [Ephydatia muelleri]
MEWRSRQDGRVSTVSPATPTTDNGAAEKHGNAATATSGGTATAEGRSENSTPPSPSKSPFLIFFPFDSTTELWTDNWAHFQTFIGANSVPVGKQAQVFLTNQLRVNYKLLSNLTSQQSPPKDINGLSLEEIAEYMKGQFDPARYVVRERFKFWSAMDRKPGESVHELAA